MTLFSRPLFREGTSHLRSCIDLAHQAVVDRKKQYHEDSVLQPAWREVVGLTRSRRMCSGDIKLRHIRKLLDEFGVVRTEDQITFHEAQIHALLPLIYGSEWARESTRVMKEEGISKINPRVLIFARRRVGKTWSICMLVGALLMVLQNFTIVVISTGGRISTKLRDTCRMLLNNVSKDVQERIFITPEHLYMRAAGSFVTGKAIKHSAGVSTLSSYPSDADSYKGTGKDELFKMIKSGRVCWNTNIQEDLVWWVFAEPGTPVEAMMEHFAVPQGPGRCKYLRLAFADQLKASVHIQLGLPLFEDVFDSFKDRMMIDNITLREHYKREAAEVRQEDPLYYVRDVFLQRQTMLETFPDSVTVVTDFRFENEAPAGIPWVSVRLYRGCVPEPDPSDTSERSLDSYKHDILLLDEPECLQRLPQYSNYIVRGCLSLTPQHDAPLSRTPRLAGSSTTFHGDRQ